jgi:hypothetical protein
MNRTVRLASIGALLIAAITAFPLPVLAGTESEPGGAVLCRYRTSSPPGQAWEALLKRIIVSPPTLFATNGQQTVGWRFAVRRTVYDGSTSQSVTYRSPIQTAKATTTTSACFDAMSVPVTLPANHDDMEIYYEIAIRTFRYRADGSLISSSLYLANDYTVRVHGDGWGYKEHQYSNRCYDTQAAVF